MLGCSRSSWEEPRGKACSLQFLLDSGVSLVLGASAGFRGPSWVVPGGPLGSAGRGPSAALWGLPGTSRDLLLTMPRSPTVPVVLGVGLRPWHSFLRTVLALLLLALGPWAEGNQERWMISVRFSFCLSS